MKTILVTGASGYLGNYLIKELRKNNFKIICLKRNPKKYFKLDFCKTYNIDITDKNSLKTVLNDKKIDLVIHLAAIKNNHDPNIEKVNVIGTKNLIEICEQNNVKKIIYISSTAAHSQTDLYGKTKKRAEEIIKSSKLEYVILRVGTIYSEDSPFIINLITLIKTIPIFTPIIGDGKYKINPVYINDVISSIIEIINKGCINRKTYYIVGPKPIEFNKFINLIKKSFNINTINIHIPIFLSYFILFIIEKIKYSPLLSKSFITSIRNQQDYPIFEARKDFNYNPIEFNEGIKRIFQESNTLLHK